MHMTFWWDYNLDNFLFYGYNVTTILGLIATTILVATLGFLFEYVKLLQAKQRQKELFVRAKQVRQICPMVEDSSSLLPNAIRQPLDLSLKFRAKLYASDAILWFILHVLAYITMLTVMSYNLWIFLSLLVGGALGHFIFGYKFMKINLENCHVLRDTYCMAKCTKPDSYFLYIVWKKEQREAQAKAQAQAQVPHEGQSTPVAEASSSSRLCHNIESPSDYNKISVVQES